MKKFLGFLLVFLFGMFIAPTVSLAANEIQDQSKTILKDNSLEYENVDLEQLYLPIDVGKNDCISIFNDYDFYTLSLDPIKGFPLAPKKKWVIRSTGNLQ